MPTVSSDAQNVLSGASAEATQYVLANTPGQNLTSGEASRLLAQYNANPDAVMSAGNIAATNSNPTPAPDDLLGIRKQVYSELGVNDLQQKFNDIYGQLNAFDTATEEQSRKIMEQPLSMNELRGANATATELRATERSGLARQAEVARSALLAAQQEAQAVYGIRESEVQQKRQYLLQYPGAGFTMADSFETISKKLGDYQEKVKKDDYKASLKEKLISLGLKTSGNTKSLEARLKKANKSLLEQTKQENALKLEALKADIANTKSLIANRNSGGGMSESEIKSANEAYIYNNLSSAARGSDGFVDPSIWRAALGDWQQAGGSTSDFLDKFGGKLDNAGNRVSGFINPYDL